MADIFISYSHHRRSIAEALESQLQDCGFDVWRDTGLHAGEQFNDAIRRQIHDADAVIVIWSTESAESKYVWLEAGMGLALKKLVPVKTTELLTLPNPFSSLHTANVDEIEIIKTSLEPLVKKLNVRAVRALNAADPGLGAEFESFVAKCRDYGIQIQPTETLSHRVLAPVGSTSLNFGTIGRAAKLYVNDFCGSNIPGRYPDITRTYLNSLARLLVGSEPDCTATKTMSWTLKKDGKIPSVRPAIENAENWIAAIKTAQNHYNAALRSD